MNPSKLGLEPSPASPESAAMHEVRVGNDHSDGTDLALHSNVVDPACNSLAPVGPSSARCSNIPRAAPIAVLGGLEMPEEPEEIVKRLSNDEVDAMLLKMLREDQYG